MKLFFVGKYQTIICLHASISSLCGSSSFGRARPCQGRGGRFEPGLPLIISRPGSGFFFKVSVTRVVELVDTQDLKSCSQQCECGFNSHPEYGLKGYRNFDNLFCFPYFYFTRAGSSGYKTSSVGWGRVLKSLAIA